MCKIENRVNLDVIKTTFSKEGQGLIIREINPIFETRKIRSVRSGSNSITYFSRKI